MMAALTLAGLITECYFWVQLFRFQHYFSDDQDQNEMMIDLNACYAFDDDDGDDSGPGSSKEETPKRLFKYYLNINHNYSIKINRI